MQLLAIGAASFPVHATAWSLLAACQAAADRTDEAKDTVARLLGVSPGFVLKHIVYSRPYKLAADQRRFVDALRKAGVPEG